VNNLQTLSPYILSPIFLLHGFTWLNYFSPIHKSSSELQLFRACLQFVGRSCFLTCKHIYFLSGSNKSCENVSAWITCELFTSPTPASHRGPSEFPRCAAGHPKHREQVGARQDKWSEKCPGGFLFAFTFVRKSWPVFLGKSLAPKPKQAHCFYGQKYLQLSFRAARRAGLSLVHP